MRLALCFMVGLPLWVAVSALHAEQRVDTNAGQELRRRLAAALGGRWSVTDDLEGIAVESVYSGWPSSKYCRVDLPVGEQKRLGDVDTILKIINDFGSERGPRAAIVVSLRGYSDGIPFYGTKMSQQYKCRDGFVEGDSGTIAAQGGQSAQDDYRRLARYRAVTLWRAFRLAFRARHGGTPGSVVDGEPRFDFEEDVWDRDRVGPDARAVKIKINIRLFDPEPSTEPDGSAVDGGQKGSSDGGNLLRTDDQLRLPPEKKVTEKDEYKALSVGAAVGVFSPLTAEARRRDFGANALAMVAVRFAPDHPRWLAVLGLASLAWRPDGMILLNERWEHYTTTIIGVGGATEFQAHIGRTWLATGLVARLLHVRRLLIFNSSSRDQVSFAFSGGPQVDVGIHLAGNFRLWSIASVEASTLKVIGGVSSPLSGQVALGLLYSP
jgi:hypothetical protein